MDTEERKQKQLELVETIGLAFENENMQPVVGRILGLLMVMDKEDFTFDEIVEELNISKSSASVGLKFLQLKNMVEYITLPGDRKRYFRVKRYEADSIMIDIRQHLLDKRTLFSKVVAVKSDMKSRNALYLIDMIAVIDRFIEAFDKYRSQTNDENKNEH